MNTVHKRPRLTNRIAKSLSQIVSLAENDMEADENRFTADDWAGIHYLNRLIAWEGQKKLSSKATKLVDKGKALP